MSKTSMSSIVRLTVFIMILLPVQPGAVKMSAQDKAPITKQSTLTLRESRASAALITQQDSIPLTSGQPVTGSLPAVSGGTLFNPQFTIAVPEGAIQLTVELTGSDPVTDLDVFIRFGQPVELINGQPVFDHVGNSLLPNETVIIVPSTSPPLRVGTYFIALASFGPNATNFTLTATVTTGGPPPPDTIMLTSGVPFTGSLPAVPGPTLFNPQFTIAVPEGATQLTVELTGSDPVTDLDVFIRFGQPVDIVGGQAVFDHSGGSPTSNETVIITAATIPPLRVGTYFIALASFGPNATNFTLTATVTTFDVCLQDEASGNSLLFNSQTGDYVFTSCDPKRGFTIGGRGSVTVSGCATTLKELRGDRGITATFDSCSSRGSASIRVVGAARAFTIIDPETTGNTCSCQ